MNNNHNRDPRPMNGTTKWILGLLISILLTGGGYAILHSQETSRLLDIQLEERVRILESRQADVRERLKAMESRMERMEAQEDLARFQSRK